MGRPCAAITIWMALKGTGLGRALPGEEAEEPSEAAKVPRRGGQEERRGPEVAPGRMELLWGPPDLHGCGKVSG